MGILANWFMNSLPTDVEYTIIKNPRVSLGDCEDCPLDTCIVYSFNNVLYLTPMGVLVYPYFDELLSKHILKQNETVQYAIVYDADTYALRSFFDKTKSNEMQIMNERYITQDILDKAKLPTSNSKKAMEEVAREEVVTSLWHTFAIHDYILVDNLTDEEDVAYLNVHEDYLNKWDYTIKNNKRVAIKRKTPLWAY